MTDLRSLAGLIIFARLVGEHDPLPLDQGQGLPELVAITRAPSPGQGGFIATLKARICFFVRQKRAKEWIASSGRITRAKDRTKKDPTFPFNLHDGCGAFFTYGYNDWGVREFVKVNDRTLGLGGDVKSEKDLIPESTVRMPSDMVCISDTQADGVWDCAVDPCDGGNFNSPAKEWPSKRHTFGSNILLADGHSEYHKMMDLGGAQAQRRI